MTKAKITFARIEFLKPDFSGDKNTLTNCTVTYDLSKASGTTLLECPFEVDAGDYVGMFLFINDAIEVLVDDPANGFFTDSSTGGFASTQPADGAGFITLREGSSDANSAAIFFPVSVKAGESFPLYIVTDMIHTLQLTVSAGAVDFTPGSVLEPVVVAATTSRTGRSAFYAESNALAIKNLHSWARIFYASDGFPIVARAI